jgi:hypothetical protein
MSESSNRADAGILDVLYAVALGEGFLWGASAIREGLASGAFAAPGALPQAVGRILLAFLIIMLSWVHYRRAMLPRREYPIAEFVTDVTVMMVYLVLFQLFDVPVAYYAAVASLWLLYWLARAVGWLRSPKYLFFGLGYALLFAVLALSAWVFPGKDAEWLRLAVATVAACLYRPLDYRCAPRLAPAGDPP